MGVAHSGTCSMLGDSQWVWSWMRVSGFFSEVKGYHGYGLCVRVVGIKDLLGLWELYGS